MANAPSVMISWAHRDPGWDDARTKSWSEEVLGLATALRTIGFDTEIDLFHLHERHIDWSRWGPLQVREQDVVLVAISQGWQERWDGTNDPHTGAGAAAEADALLGIYNKDGQRAFREKVILVVLPSMRQQPVIPDRLTGVNRVELDDFSEQSLLPLVHLLEESPLYDLPPLGVLRPLAPVPAPEPGSSPGQDLEVLDERIRTLRSAAAGLGNAERRTRRPTDERISLQIDLQLAELLKERAERRRRGDRGRARRVVSSIVLVGLAVGALGAVALDPRARGQHHALAHASAGASVSSLATLPDPPRTLTLPRLHSQTHLHVAGSSNSSSGLSSTGEGLNSSVETGGASKEAPTSGQGTAGPKEGTRSDHTSKKPEGGGTKESSGGA